jgi:predicted N-acetyltransferase YhbS
MGPEPVVRIIGPAEFPAYLRSARTAFLNDREPSDAQVQWSLGHTDLTRTFGAFADGGLRGGCRSFPVELTVPGGRTLTAAAVTNVNVAVTHRRRGLLRRMMHAQLLDVRQRGEPVAILISSEWPIYGRFGYGPASEQAAIEIDTTRARVRAPAEGHVELVEAKDLRALAPAVYEQFAARTVGAVSRTERWWDVLADVDVPPDRPPPRERVRAVWRDGAGKALGYTS